MDSYTTDDPEQAVLNFKVLRKNAEGIETNQKEHERLTAQLEKAGAFRMPAYTTSRGLILDRTKQAAPRYENEVRELKLEHGFAIDANDPKKAIPMKLALAVPLDTRKTGATGTELTMADWKQNELKKTFEPFVKPAVKFIKEQGGKVRFGFLGPFLETVKTKPTWKEVMKMQLPGGRDKGRLKVFAETFPGSFEVRGMMVHLAGVASVTAGARAAEGPRERMRIHKRPAGKR